MVVTKIVITNPSGLHTRPAKKIVDEAKKFASEITLVKGDKEGSAKSLIKLMKLGIALGSTIEIRCEGGDEQAALDTISSLITNLSD